MLTLKNLFNFIDGYLNVTTMFNVHVVDLVKFILKSSVCFLSVLVY